MSRDGGAPRALGSRATSFVTALGIVLVLASASGCRMSSDETRSSGARPTRPIEDVQRDHTAELMQIPGVVGVYQGALDDGTPFIGVMVAKKTPELARRIPKELEGYRVKIEVTGEIRPLEGGGK